jgi:hypothetical protein
MTNHTRPLILGVVTVATAFSLLAAGCGGGSSPGVAASAGTTTIEYGASGAQASALAFARCMRSHGVPNWPDPQIDGGFDKAKLRQLGIGLPRLRSIEGRYCHVDFENPGEAQTITAAERADYLRAAACMRRHGFPDFPDPTFPGNSVRVDIPASIDQSSSRFRNAATICTKLIPEGLPYTRPPGQ